MGPITSRGVSRVRMPITLVLGDEHPIVLDGLEHLFRLEKIFKILARCTTGEDTLRAVSKHRPDILVLDIHIPSENGLDVLKKIKESKLPTRCVIFTAALNDDEMLEAIRLDVSGIVLKNMASKLLIQCIKKVHAGEKWFERVSLASAAQKLVRRENAVRHSYEVLSSRQLQILRMVAIGLHNKDIGKKLFISEGTVEVHLHNIYQRLNVKSRLELALYARDKGLF
jgi:two-component system, NarL family, nitrate/nitrite response regulator NarL